MTRPTRVAAFAILCALLITPASQAADDSPAPATPDIPPADAAVIEALRAAGASVVPLSAGSPMLSIGFPSNPAAVDDATIDVILPAGPNVYSLDLSRTKVTDAGAQKLGPLNNLARLNLGQTAVTDASAAAIGQLKTLVYLNVYNTKVTDAALAELAKLPKLVDLYVWETAVTYDAAKKLRDSREGLAISLGWDNPGMARERITKELERVAEESKKAAEMAADAEEDLKIAKQLVEAAAAREAELKKELADLEAKKPDAEKPEAKE